MEDCIVCADMAMHMCTPCGLGFCSKHKDIHDKRNIKSHIISTSTLDLTPKLLNKSVTGKAKKIRINAIQCIPDYTSNHEMTGIVEWYNKNYSDYETLTEIKAKYLEYKLSKEHQIFLKGHTSSIKSVLITSDSKYIISTTCGKSIIIWNFQSRIQEGKLKGHTDVISCMAITSDNKFLVSGSADKTIRIWNIQTKTQEAILEGHSRIVSNIKIIGNDLYIVSASFDDSIRIWSLQDKMQIFMVETGRKGKGFFSHALVISRNINTLVYPARGKLIIWDIAKKKRKFGLPDTDCEFNLTSMLLATDSRILACGYCDGMIKIWNLKEKRLLKTLNDHTGWVNYLFLTSDDKFIISASSRDSTVRVWDALLLNQVTLLQDSYFKVSCIALTPNDKYIICASKLEAIIIWDLQKKKKAGSLEGHTEKVVTLAVSCDSMYLVSGSNDRTVRVWNLRQKRLIYTLPGHNMWVASIAISNDRKYIVSASHDYTVRLWNTKEKSQEAVLEGHAGPVSCVAITEDNRYIFSGSYDKTVRIWSTQKKKKSRQEAVLQIVGSSVQQWDKKIRWSFSREVYNELIESLAMTTGNKYIVAGISDGTVRVCKVQKEFR